MNAGEAIEIVKSKARGRTRYVGQPPYLDEVLVAYIERLEAKIKHCDRCGGSWVDDGINPGCYCADIARLKAERDRALEAAEAKGGNNEC